MKVGFDELVRQSDRSFSASDRCTRCRVCEKVCPAHNIRMTDNGPVWQHRCTHCLACYHLCPNQAIESGIAQQDYYYRHPEITASAIMAQRQE
jgi:MinD superfamily P-loop ATPase